MVHATASQGTQGFHRTFCSSIDDICGTQAARQGQFFVGQINGHHLRGTGCHCTHERRQAHAAQTHHGHFFSRAQLLSLFCAPRRESTASPAKADPPTKWSTGSPWYERRLPPPSKVPAALAAAAGSHSTGRPSAQGRQCPQLGTNSRMTWSPGSRSITPSPSASTTPAASWPSTMGVRRGRSPLMMERSEWHSPAAATRTSTSPGPGGASSTSVISSGRLVAYGAGAPIRVKTAARVFMPASSDFFHQRASAFRQGLKRLVAWNGVQHFVVVPGILRFFGLFDLHEVHVVHHAAVLADPAVLGEKVLNFHLFELGRYGRAIV